MSTIRELHTKAMDLAEEALVARIKGAAEKFKSLSRKAFEYERQALQLALDMSAPEPTRSVLCRSAASLAIDCGELREAERLVAVALSGDPPSDIAEELRVLLDQVNFHRHLDTKGIILQPAEMQMSIAGSAIAPQGLAESDIVLDRLGGIQLLVVRTFERKSNRPFREKGPPLQSARGYTLFFSVPRAASFAVTLRIGRPEQLALPGMDYGAELVDEIMSCLELFRRNDTEQLQERIPDPAYRRNFIGLVRRIAPDGRAVKMVGFTTLSSQGERSVLLTQPQREILLPRIPDEDQSQPSNMVQVQGELRYASELQVGAKDEIRLRDQNGKVHKVIVPQGMMSDIVKPLWEEVVIVTGYRAGKKIRLTDIRRAEQETSGSSIEIPSSL